MRQRYFRSFFSTLLLAVFLFSGCTQSSVFSSSPGIISSGLTVSIPEKADSQPETTSSKSVSGLSAVLDGEAYEGRLAIWFFNVDKPGETENVDAGDTILMRSPDGQAMMIDTGYSETIGGILENIRQIGVAQIDYLIATHMHSDHVSGADEVLDALPVGKVLTSRFAYRKVGTALKFMNVLSERGVTPEIIKEGDSFSFGESVTVEVLSPVDDGSEIPDDPYSNQHTVNENSLVLKVIYGENVFLFTGDIERGTESRLVDTYGDGIQADLLKVPHHGYSTSSSRKFVQVVKPEIAVVPQCIMPNLDIYDRYLNAGTDVYVTGMDGIVLAVSDGKTIDMITEKDREDRGSSTQPQ